MSIKHLVLILTVIYVVLNVILNVLTKKMKNRLDFPHAIFNFFFHFGVKYDLTITLWHSTYYEMILDKCM